MAVVPEAPSGAGALAAKFGAGVRLAARAGVQGFVEFYKSDNLTYASSIAYYALLSLFPFLLLLLSILGQVALTDGSERLLALIARVLPRQIELVSGQIQALAARVTELTVAGVLLLLWASMGVFGAVTNAVNHAWGVEQPVGFFKHKLVSFAMVFAAGALMILTLVLVSAVEVAESRWFAPYLSQAPWLARVTNFAVRNAPTPMFIGVVGLVYYFVPNTRVRLRDVWFGAVLAGLLWQGAFAGFTWFVKDLSRFSVHGSIAAVVAFLLWVYVSAVILLYGVEVTAAYARLRRMPESSWGDTVHVQPARG
jgi:membrane protein